MADKTIDEATKAALDIFTNYVSERNISIMTKAEWEMLYFYCTAKQMFPQTAFITLSAANLYALGVHLQLDSTKVSSLLKKCYRLEYKTVNEMDFIALFKTNAILNMDIDGSFVQFSITNTLAQERVKNILDMEGIFSDASFKKSIFRVPVYGMLMLLDKEHPSKNFLNKLKSLKETVVRDIMNLVKPNDAKESKDITTQLMDAINNHELKSAAKFIMNAASIIGQPIKTVCDIVLPKLTDNPGKAIAETLK